MARYPLVALLLFAPLLVCAQDSPQVARLEQEVRQLQREVSLLSQLVTQLRARLERIAALGGPSTALSPAPPSPKPSVQTAANENAPPLARWINAARWKALRIGASELDVVGELGAPSSVRGTNAERVLLYALEIGPSSFLAGSVTFRDQAVVAIETPTLK